MLLKEAKKRSIDINQNEKYIIADLKSQGCYFTTNWKKFKENERKIELGLKEYDKLYKLLEEGNYSYYLSDEKECGGNDYEGIVDFCYHLNESVTLDELSKLRRVVDTQNLYNDIDKLSIDELRTKYFKMEVYNVEEN